MLLKICSMFGLVYTNNIVYNAYSNLSENNLIRDS